MVVVIPAYEPDYRLENLVSSFSSLQLMHFVTLGINPKIHNNLILNTLNTKSLSFSVSDIVYSVFKNSCNKNREIAGSKILSLNSKATSLSINIFFKIFLFLLILYYYKFSLRYIIFSFVFY